VTLEGKQLGIYRVGAELGRGGMGTVYRAVTTAAGPAGPAGSDVALKVFHAHLVEDERTFERFRREADIGKRIRHAHVVRTYDVAHEEVEGQPVHYMVMEVIEGQTLDDLLKELGTVPDHLLYQIADQVLAALQAIHERGIVHRDIKPENIVITPDHRVLLMDLGVARLQGEGEALTQAGEFVGSLAYAAPEQFMPQEGGVGPRADLYAFGVVLFELATGRNPFGTADLSALLQKKLQEELPAPRAVLPDLDAFLAEVIVTSTRSKAAERFASAGELRAILQEGEASAWWRQRTAGVAVPTSERALKRLRLEREAPLVGRAAELGRLRDAWGRARGEGGVVLLHGPSGVGKSRLLYDFIEGVAAAGGPAVAAGRCLGAGGRSYQPFVDALHDLLEEAESEPRQRRRQIETRLADLLPETPALVPALTDFLLGGMQPGQENGLSKDALLASFLRILQRLAGERPVILAVEDLHLAGAETVELFAYLARCIPGHAVLLVGVYADEEVEEGAPLHEMVARAEGAEAVALRPLAYEGTEELVRLVVGHERTVRALARPLHERGDGNPFIVLEMLAHLRETGVLARRGEGYDLTGPVEEAAVPATVRDLFGLKLARLDDEQRETLEAGAVLGYEFDASLLAAVLEEKRIKLLQRLAGLERKQRLLVSSGKSAFRFASRQLYEAVYDAITPALRVEYHALVADTIREQLDEEGVEEPRGEPAYALLNHLFFAERALEAEPFLEAAIDYLAAHYHAGFAAPFLEKVAAAYAVARAPKRFALAMKLWAFYELLGRREDQLRELEQAGAAAEEMGEPGPRGRVHACLAGSLFLAGDYEKAEAEVRAGLDLARAAGDRKWESNALHLLGALHHRRGRFAEAAARWREALAVRREIGDRRGEASSLQALAAVMPLVGEGASALETKQASLAIWREIGDRRGEAAVLCNLAISLADAGRYEESLRHLEQAIEIDRELGAATSEAHDLCNLGRTLGLVGRIDQAKRSYERALDLFRTMGSVNGELAVLTLLGPLLTSYGDYGVARDYLERAVSLAEESGSRAKLAAAERELGTLLHRSGARERGWELLGKALALEEEMGSGPSRALALDAIALAALLEEDHARAAAGLEDALALRAAPDQTRALTLCRLARALRGRGDTEAARSRAAEARALVAGLPQVTGDTGPEIWFTLADFAPDAEDRRRDLDRALALLEARKGAIRNDAYREHYLTQTWPNAEILEEARRILGR